MLSSSLSGLICFACLHLCCAFPCYRQTLIQYHRHQTWFFYIEPQWSSTPSTLYLRQAIGCTSLLNYQGQPLFANAIARIQSTLVLASRSLGRSVLLDPLLRIEVVAGSSIHSNSQCNTGQILQAGTVFQDLNQTWTFRCWVSARLVWGCSQCVLQGRA